MSICIAGDTSVGRFKEMEEPRFEVTELGIKKYEELEREEKQNLVVTEREKK